MKNLFRFIRIVSIITVIGFSLSGCDVLSGTNDTDDKGGGGSNSTVTIRNNTSQNFLYGYRKPSSSTDWGSDIFSSGIPSGQSQTITLPSPLSTYNVYDFSFSSTSGTTSGNNFVKYGTTVTNGMTITFTNSDLNDGSNLPNITVQNRSGINFNSVYVKPSSTNEWNRNFGSLSNNSSMEVTIPIPPSNYTVFDIQLRTSDPTVPGTFTKTNVTITNGMTINFGLYCSELLLLVN